VCSSLGFCVCSSFLWFLVPSLNKQPEITLARPSGAVTAIEAGPSTGVTLLSYEGLAPGTPINLNLIR